MILIYFNKDLNKILFNFFGELEICSLNCWFKLLSNNLFYKIVFVFGKFGFFCISNFFIFIVFYN